MRYIITMALLLTFGLSFGQKADKKLLGKWVCCEKTELLNKFDQLTFVKDEAAATNACIEKSCHYSKWNFVKDEDALKLMIDMYSGCKDATAVSSANSQGTWSADKKNTLTIFDEHFTKHVFEITSLTDKELVIKRNK